MSYDLPSGLGWASIAIFAFIFVIATIIFALRVYVRVKRLGPFGTAEDWSAGIGWLLFACYSGVSMVAPFFGQGQHVALIPVQDLPVYLKIEWASGLIYWPAGMAVKLSITLMLLRFAVEESHRRLIYAVGAVFQLYSVAFIFVYIFQCLPLSFFWTRAQGDTNGRCMDPTVLLAVGYIYAGIAFLYDVTMGLLPWLMVRKMRLDLRTRLMIAGVLALGSITYIATAIRIPFMVQLSRDPADSSYAIVGASVTSCVELGLCIIASSAATLKPLFRRRSTRRIAARPTPPKLASIPMSSEGTNPSQLTMYDMIDVSADRWIHGS